MWLDELNIILVDIHKSNINTKASTIDTTVNKKSGICDNILKKNGFTIYIINIPPSPNGIIVSRHILPLMLNFLLE